MLGNVFCGRALAFAIALALPAPAFAQGITIDGSTATSVSAGLGGGLVVDIAPANGRGVSVNSYSRFDVGAAGAVLNNESQVANVIVNQVTGNSASALNGVLSVRGAEADVILANPNGISVNGAGFENMRGLLLISGRQGADPLSYSIDGGAITVGPEGMVAGIRRLDLLARDIAVNGAVSDGQADPFVTIGLHAGAGAVTLNPDAFTPDAPDYLTFANRGTQTEDRATLVLGQGANLSGGRLLLTADGRGAGVNMTGGRALAAEGNFVLTAEGKVRIAGGVVEAQQQLRLNANSAEITGATLTADSIDLRATGSVVAEASTLRGQTATTIAAQDLTALSSADVRTIIEAQTGALEIALTGDLDVQGALLQGDGSGTAVTVDVAGDMALASLSEAAIGSVFARTGGLKLVVGGTVANRSGRVLSDSRIDAEVQGDFLNQTALRSADDGLGLTYALGQEVSQLAANGPLAVQVGGLFSNTGLVAGSQVAITADQIENALVVLGEVRREKRCVLFFCRGRIIGGVSFDGGRLDATQSLTLTARTRFVNTGGGLSAGTGITITAPEIRFDALRYVTGYSRSRGLYSLFSGAEGRFIHSYEGGSITLSTGEVVLVADGNVTLEATSVEPEAALRAVNGFTLVKTPEGVALRNAVHIGLFAFLF